MTERRRIAVEALARVEGEGGLSLVVRDGRVEEVELRIFEPPRFFEAFLRGRHHSEAPDITARICGICPVAYQMSAVHALEALFGVTMDPPLRALRRLFYCGEWIASHALHVFLLHAPDFLGCEDAIALAREHRDVVERGLRLKKVGNALMRVIGGREVHPINACVGGFHRAPRPAELRALRDDLAWGRDAAVETVRFASRLPFPDFACPADFVALRHPHEYPMNEGEIVSTGGLRVPPSAFDDAFEEHQVARSTALHAGLRGGGAYFVGPLARYNLNADRLSSTARDAAEEAGLGGSCRNPFQSIVVRAVEIAHAYEEALRIVDAYAGAERSRVPYEVRPGTGHGATEAPRGLLYHRYTVDERGVITDARIVPPTSQNQAAIEGDLGRFAERNLALSDADLTWRCEQAIRNYDPCISCSTHFLRLEIDRG